MIFPESWPVDRTFELFAFCDDIVYSFGDSWLDFACLDQKQGT